MENIILTRYEFPDGDCVRNHTGLLMGIDEVMNGRYDKILLDAYNEFSKNLTFPDCDFSIDTISYFTIDGINKFLDYIITILHELRKFDIHPKLVQKIIHMDDPDIIYQDKYQIILRR